MYRNHYGYVHMNGGISLIPKGRNFTRSVILRATGGGYSLEETRTAALTRWGAAGAEDIAKAAVPAVHTGEMGNQTSAAVEFFDLVRGQSIYGRLTGLRKVPFYARMLRMSGGANGYWIGQAKPTPLSKPAFADGSGLPSAKVAAMVVVTDEAVKFGGVAEQTFEADLRRAVTASWDQAFIARDNGGEVDGQQVVRPASVTYGAPQVEATSDPVADIGSLIAGFAGDLGAAYFITDPKTAAQLGLHRSGGNLVFPDVGPRGGTISGIPVLTSSSSPRDASGGQVALIDPTGIAAADEGLDVERSNQASLLMSDDPEGDAPEMVSLFQNNLTALKSSIFSNWRVERPGSVGVLINANYPAGG
ncbi:phage major capsid protein [Stenotrophomonas sp. NPDC078853]|uniref:phage major capsid protein n=1 Tax=Stenotrophomonas sp. NPDC078853 TaxID=3364534 RepID=UPI00384C1D57